jgi:hypothetical protein
MRVVVDADESRGTAIVCDDCVGSDVETVVEVGTGGGDDGVVVESALESGISTCLFCLGD